MKIELVKIDTEFNANSPYCWVQTRAGIFPDGRVLITSQPLRLSGSDIFYGINCFFSKDHACSWNGPVEQKKLQRRPFKNNQEIVLCDVTPEYHDRSCKMLGIGHTAIYQNDDFPKEKHPHYTAYSVFNESDGCWGEFKLLRLPEVFMDHYSSSCSQRVDLDDGTILLPIYHRSKNTGLNAREVTVIRCSFDGENLHYMEHGNTLNSTIHNGLCEPSVFKFKDKFYLTMRNYECGLVSQSNDGLNYSEAVKWRFDDGKEIGNYNTQQHWLSLGEKLYLVYTRKGANNDNVFRHRAPLFMAEVDTENLCLIRETEQIVIPNRGARLGNFGCLQVSKNEAWVVVSEWMQNGPEQNGIRKCMSYGSNNSIFVAKISESSKIKRD